MKIHAKVFSLLATVFLLLAVVDWGVGRLLLVPRFEQIEHDDAVTAMRRIENALDQKLSELAVSATDWGNWADSYRFMLDRNEQYAGDNLQPAALKQLHLTVLAIVNTDGTLVWSQSVDPVSAAPVALDFLARLALPEDFPWRESLSSDRIRQGLIATNHGIVLAAVAPILDGFGHGPSRGLMLMGRMLTRAEINEIGRKAQTRVDLATPMESTGRLAPVARRNEAVPSKQRVIAADAVTQVFRDFDDIGGRPVMTLRVDVPRTISAGARATVAYTTAFTVGVAIVVLLLMLVVLDRVVLGPLGRVTAHAVAIGKGDDLTTRLDLRRADEIGLLGDELDRMVLQLADSRRAHIDHSFQAGMAEFSRGVLHNVGNAMTPLCVGLARLQDALRTAPTADVERALAERSRAPVDPARQADLDEFLRLACGELAHTIKATEANAGVAARQAAVVQNALAAQLRSSKGAVVIEPVELPAVIGQSLEIVPDAARERLAVEMDESVRALGILRLARTVLRLVLQNIIINASEAVRAAGRDRGVLRVRAAVTEDAGRQQLVLQCEDTGVGIDAQNLKRIFERGFSTKKAHGNVGIGLHWSATAVSALGGRIWATSEGVGHGATIHLVMPIAGAAAGLNAEGV